MIHAAPKLDITELIKVAEQLSCVLDDKFVKESRVNYDLLNPIVAQNIDYKTPEQGEVYYKLVMIAKERNINYTPSMEA